MYEVIGRPNSRAFRIMWMLEELGEDYTLTNAGAHSKEVYAANPSGKIPAMRDGEHTLTQSVAIMTYLADKHGAMTAKPGTVDRAHQDAVVHMLLDEFESPLWTFERMSGLYPEARRVPEAKDTLQWEFMRNVPRLVETLKGPFLMGDTMTIADILCTSCLNWAIHDKFPVEDPKLTDYVKAMTNRPAFLTARKKGMAAMQA